MVELALALAFVLQPPLIAERLEVQDAPWVTERTQDRESGCRAARRILESGACLRPEDCGAFEGWMRLFGEPRTEPLDPVRARRERIRPGAYLCFADAGVAGERGGGR